MKRAARPAPDAPCGLGGGGWTRIDALRRGCSAGLFGGPGTRAGAAARLLGGPGTVAGAARSLAGVAARLLSGPGMVAGAAARLLGGADTLDRTAGSLAGAAARLLGGTGTVAGAAARLRHWEGSVDVLSRVSRWVSTAFVLQGSVCTRLREVLLGEAGKAVASFADGGAAAALEAGC